MSHLVNVREVEVKLVELNSERIKDAKKAIKKNELKLDLGFTVHNDGIEKHISVKYFTDNDTDAPGHLTEILEEEKDSLKVKFKEFSFKFKIKPEYKEVFLSPDTKFTLSTVTWTGGGANILAESLESETKIKKFSWGDHEQITHFIDLKIS